MVIRLVTADLKLVVKLIVKLWWLEVRRLHHLVDVLIAIDKMLS